MLRPEDYQNLQEQYTISREKYLEHEILLDTIRNKESNAQTVIRKQNLADVGMELSNSEIADNLNLLKEVLKEKAHHLGYQSPFNVILQLHPKFRVIAVLEMFYKLEIRAVHLVNGGHAFLLLTTHDEIRICDIKNYTLEKAINAVVDKDTGSYIVNRYNYEESIKTACILRHETNRASVGFIFHEHKPSLEEMNFILDCIDKRSKAEFLTLTNSIEKESVEPLFKDSEPIFDEVTLPFDDTVPTNEDELLPDYAEDKEPESAFVPEFKQPVTYTPLDADNELPF